MRAYYNQQIKIINASVGSTFPQKGKINARPQNNMKDLTKLKGYDKLNEFEQNNLKETYQAILDGNIYADVTSVSRSGMSRRIKFYYINDNIKSIPPYIDKCTAQIAWLTGWINCDEYQQGSKYLAEDGLRVGGCGMDMILHTLLIALGYKDAESWNQRYNRL